MKIARQLEPLAAAGLVHRPDPSCLQGAQPAARGGRGDGTEREERALRGCLQHGRGELEPQERRRRQDSEDGAEHEGLPGTGVPGDQADEQQKSRDLHQGGHAGRRRQGRGVPEQGAEGGAHGHRGGGHRDEPVPGVQGGHGECAQHRDRHGQGRAPAGRRARQQSGRHRAERQDRADRADGTLPEAASGAGPRVRPHRPDSTYPRQVVPFLSAFPFLRPSGEAGTPNCRSTTRYSSTRQARTVPPRTQPDTRHRDHPDSPSTDFSSPRAVQPEG